MAAGNRQQWIERARGAAGHPRLPDAASVALVALLGWQLAGVTWTVLPAPARAALPPASAPQAEPAGRQEEAAPTARLARLHLFGEAGAGAEAQPAPEKATDAPETQLNLTLKGVFAAGDSAGLAIIATGSGPEKVYSTGDTVAGSARITGIFADRIVLRRNGQAETLRLDQAAAAPDQPQGTASGSGGGSGDVIDRARTMRERLLQNPMELARMVRFQPYRENGELVGFRIQPRTEEARLLRELGIKEQDVVTRVNGMSLNSPQQANRVLQELRDASTINVTVLRDGRSRRLSIPIGDPG